MDKEQLTAPLLQKELTETPKPVVDVTLRRVRELEAAIETTINENLHLADGEICTLAKLKKALNHSSAS